MGPGLAVLAIAGGAEAQEFRLGVGQAPHGPEKGDSMVVEYVFPPIKALSFIGSPKPYVGAQVSLEDYTNYAQAGVLWRFERERVYFDLGGGLSVHDGNLTLPRPTAGESVEENERRRDIRRRYIEFDTRWLFHATFAVGYRLTDKWAVEFEGQHWSNGQLGNDTHDGSDSLGLRASYRF